MVEARRGSPGVGGHGHLALVADDAHAAIRGQLHAHVVAQQHGYERLRGHVDRREHVRVVIQPALKVLKYIIGKCISSN